MISLSLVFDSIYKSELYITALVIGFSFHFIDMVKSIISVKTQDGKRYDKLNDIIFIYICNQGIPDCLLISAYLSEILFYGTVVTQLTRYIFLLKIIPLLKKLDFFEHAIIQNVYWEQVWNLVKLFLVNYVFAHFLALILISMTKLSQEETWMNFRHINMKP